MHDLGPGRPAVYNLPGSQQLVQTLPTASERPPARLVLASGSRIRRQLLANAGLAFTLDPADIDEDATVARLRARSSAVALPGLAQGLAEAKALHVGARHAGALVIGADQMLELDGEILSKAADAAAGRAVLMRLRGRAHHLHSGVALASDGNVLWSHVQSATLHMRRFSEAWLDAYLAASGDAATASVGAYQLEGPGVQLFERIEGDYFTILGLPLLALLTALRTHGVTDE